VRVVKAVQEGKRADDFGSSSLQASEEDFDPIVVRLADVGDRVVVHVQQSEQAALVKLL
jgi:hypothetical protein